MKADVEIVDTTAFLSLLSALLCYFKRLYIELQRLALLFRIIFLMVFKQVKRDLAKQISLTKKYLQKSLKNLKVSSSLKNLWKYDDHI